MQRPENMLPREKALALGLKALSDIELMAIIFSTGLKGKPVKELCAEILEDHKGHLSAVASMEPAQFIEKYKGIGPAKALTLLAALELGARAGADAASVTNPKLSSSDAAYEIIKHRFYQLDHEEFWVLYLKQNNELIKEMRIGQGGWAATAVDTRMVLREALMLKASAMILCHNHPSGNLQSSPQDDEITRRISQSATIMGFKVLDHIIVSATGFYSYRDNGKIL